MERRSENKNQSKSSYLSSKKGIQESREEPCEVCGSVGIAGLMMICFKCRHTREHTYCAKAFLPSVPDIWLCEACWFPSRVFFISNVAEDLMDLETTVADPKNTNNSRVDDHGAAKLRTNDMEDVVVATRDSSCEISANVNSVMHLPSQPLVKETLSSHNKEQQHQPTQAFPKKRRTIRVMGKHLSQSHDQTLISPLDQSLTGVPHQSENQEHVS
ncbi:unnamed protein product [Eruca vesicaria subsp. sativa]|uniref:Zinc finger PHD-type domain-containing protein n=1 Tax=Eruca vesicaria subsp. sativa TaxID=29727 RepID=A0ABC8M1X9_ERUVS|nr:unnamed protein product [Eruca vesicaria subsp. sativa]